MIQIHSLPKITTRKKKRIGHGYGSGRAKTSGRGSKGQKARGKIRLGFEGGQLPFIRRLPYRRGFKSLAKKPLIINVGILDLVKEGTEVTKEKLVDLGLIPSDWGYGIKILGDGELEKKIVVKKIPCSKGAIRKIEAAGGKVEVA